ncbi:hypothetical protein [Hamadaea tsunoensis]|uniref:hypothetical protein n=1 Tax=Hamadaea tsunoensis TaxID=53368 RepID=UPI00040B171C|nr:hypothetical protein [Hamadaea tsunoensis]
MLHQLGAAALTTRVIADNNFGDTRSGGLAGPMGLLLIIVLGAATVLLIRNMGKRIKRLPSSFDGEAPTGQATSTDVGALPGRDSGSDVPMDDSDAR